MRAAILVPLLLAGCARSTAVPAGSCDAALARVTIGTAYSAAVGERARRLAGARAVRVIRPGDAVTMDYREDRLNIHLDAAGRLTDLRCG